MKKGIIFAAIMSIVFILDGKAFAHFGMVIPSDSMVTQKDSKTITLNVSFSHPFEGVGMDLTKPKVFGVRANGKTFDLRPNFKKGLVMGHTAWKIGT
jgi:cobalt/nickel transport protein